MSAKSSVMPPSRKLEKLVIATAASVKRAANVAVPSDKPAMKAERTTTSPVMEPSVNPATTSMIGSFFNNRLRHSLPNFAPCSVSWTVSSWTRISPSVVISCKALSTSLVSTHTYFVQTLSIRPLSTDLGRVFPFARFIRTITLMMWGSSCISNDKQVSHPFVTDSMMCELITFYFRKQLGF